LEAQIAWGVQRSFLEGEIEGTIRPFNGRFKFMEKQEEEQTKEKKRRKRERQGFVRGTGSHGFYKHLVTKRAYFQCWVVRVYQSRAGAARYPTTRGSFVNEQVIFYAFFQHQAELLFL
jgi:hypothetical protein